MRSYKASTSPGVLIGADDPELEYDEANIDTDDDEKVDVVETVWGGDDDVVVDVASVAASAAAAAAVVGGGGAGNDEDDGDGDSDSDSGIGACSDNGKVLLTIKSINMTGIKLMVKARMKCQHHMLPTLPTPLPSTPLPTPP